MNIPENHTYTNTVQNLMKIPKNHTNRYQSLPKIAGSRTATSERFSLVRGELQASYARAGNELCDFKNRRRLVADVKNTFRVSASFGRLQKIVGDPENSRNARRNIGCTTAVNVV
ncbi:hypothetical protein Bbelb_428230 [Branchiostoma belcheri]|nr:hypothetical protein Bbelb_428230 [Branchiostoma belcheri]